MLGLQPKYAMSLGLSSSYLGLLCRHLCARSGAVRDADPEARPFNLLRTSLSTRVVQGNDHERCGNQWAPLDTPALTRSVLPTQSVISRLSLKGIHYKTQDFSTYSRTLVPRYLYSRMSRLQARACCPLMHQTRHSKVVWAAIRNPVPFHKRLGTDVHQSVPHTSSQHGLAACMQGVNIEGNWWDITTRIWDRSHDTDNTQMGMSMRTSSAYLFKLDKV